MQFSAAADLTLPSQMLIPTPRAVRYSDIRVGEDDRDENVDNKNNSFTKRRASASDTFQQGKDGYLTQFKLPESPKGSIREFQQRFIRPRAYLLPPESSSSTSSSPLSKKQSQSEKAVDDKKKSKSNVDSVQSNLSSSSTSSTTVKKDNPPHLEGTPLIGGGILVFLIILFLAVATQFFINRSYTSIQSCGWIVCNTKNDKSAATPLPSVEVQQIETNDLLSNSSSSSSTLNSLNSTSAILLIDGNSSISINASIHDDDAMHLNNSNGDNKSSSTLPIQSQSTQQKDEVTNDTSPSLSPPPPPPPSPSFTDNVIEENVDDVTSSQQAAKAPIKPKSKKGVKKPCGNPYGLCGMDNVPT
jgi:hypothetical protein